MLILFSFPSLNSSHIFSAIHSISCSFSLKTIQQAQNSKTTESILCCSVTTEHITCPGVWLVSQRKFTEKIRFPFSQQLPTTNSFSIRSGTLFQLLILHERILYSLKLYMPCAGCQSVCEFMCTHRVISYLCFLH